MQYFAIAFLYFHFMEMSSFDILQKIYFCYSL